MASVQLSDTICRYEHQSISGDFAEWIEKLKLVAKLQKIEDLKSFLPLFLNGAAFAVYKQFPDSDKADYDRLKAGLLLAFGSIVIWPMISYSSLCLRKARQSLIGQSNVEPLIKVCIYGRSIIYSFHSAEVSSCRRKLGLSDLVTQARVMLSTQKNDPACAVGYHLKQKNGLLCFSCGLGGHMAWQCSQVKFGHGRSPVSTAGGNKRYVMLVVTQGILLEIAHKIPDS